MTCTRDSERLLCANRPTVHSYSLLDSTRTTVHSTGFDATAELLGGLAAMRLPPVSPIILNFTAGFGVGMMVSMVAAVPCGVLTLGWFAKPRTTSWLPSSS